jgi:hypothetical protein
MLHSMKKKSWAGTWEEYSDYSSSLFFFVYASPVLPRTAAEIPEMVLATKTLHLKAQPSEILCKVLISHLKLLQIWMMIADKTLWTLIENWRLALLIPCLIHPASKDAWMCQLLMTPLVLNSPLNPFLWSNRKPSQRKHHSSMVIRMKPTQEKLLGRLSDLITESFSIPPTINVHQRPLTTA